MTIVSLMTLATMMAFTSCTKEATTGNGTQFRATMEGCNAAKTELNGTALEWVSGDRIAVYGTAGVGIYSATPQTPATIAVFDNVSGTTGDGPFRAFYPATLTTDGVNITLPFTQTYVEGSINEFPMYAESSDNQLAFKNLCGVLKLHLTKAGFSISSIEVVANTEVNGTFSVSYNGGEPSLSYVSGGTNRVVLTCATAKDISEGADFYISLPATVDSVKSITIFASNGYICTKRVKETSHVTVGRSQYAPITLGEADLEFRPIGSKGGLFSINADGGQVWFSQGNLQYQASTQTWQFAEHQYDRIGNSNSNISATYTGWIDLFGWGTGSNPTNTSPNTADYSTFVDWGSCAIDNGGNLANAWRTLSASEWGYIINGRSGAESKRGLGRVNGIYGEILLPDNWQLPEGLSFSNNVTNCQNTYSLSQWKEMEANGAIFLPNGGWRYTSGSTITITGLSHEHGRYWTSSEYDNNAAYELYFYPHYGTLHTSSTYKSYGYPVRLVQDND